MQNLERNLVKKHKPDTSFKETNQNEYKVNIIDNHLTMELEVINIHPKMAKAIKFPVQLKTIDNYIHGYTSKKFSSQQA